MKIAVKRLIRDEKGQTLILTLILIVVGGLITVSLLGYMGTGIKSGEVYERRMAELYAADAGVEDAVWNIQNQVDELPFPSCGDPDPDPWVYNISDVNGKKVEVTIAYVNNATYQVVSNATGDGSGTKIEAYVTGTITYCSMLDHLITIQENLDDQEVEQLETDLGKLGIPCPTGCQDLEQCEKCGQAYDYNSDAYEDIPLACKGCIAVYNFPDTGWPTEDDLSARYWEDVENETHYDSDTTIDLTGVDMDLEPLSINGTLEILNNNSELATLTLNGTLYITGDTEIGMHGKGGKPNLILDLNEQTIFVASNSSDPQKALQIGDWCTIMGPGCIIAVGDVYFAPKGDVGSNEEPVLILSVAGTTTLKPSGDFYGAIGGSVNVEAFSGETPTTTYPTSGF